jgi:NAD-dependent SIR2 family protein deacetylase
MNSQNIVIVIGAGASSTVGMPLYKDILSDKYIDILDKLQNKIAQGNLSLQIYYLRNIQKAIVRYGKHFEQLLEDYYDKNREVYDEIINYYKTLLLLSEQLQATKYPHMHINEPYFSFSRILIKLLNTNNSVSIISFNHDLLIEQCLLWKYFTYDENIDNLGGISTTGTYNEESHSFSINTTIPATAIKYKYIDNILVPFIMAPQPVKEIYSLLLLKLHGSLNQIHCPNCGRIYYAYNCINGPIVYKKKNEICDKCGTPLDDAIIPPKKTKELRSLKYIWEKAENKIRKCDILYVIGYSLPDYDIDAVELFSKTNPRATKYIYNNNYDNTMKTHFENILGKVNLMPAGFETFAINTEKAIDISK